MQVGLRTSTSTALASPLNRGVMGATSVTHAPKMNNGDFPASTEETAASNVLYEAQSQQASVSGVNMDEEAVNLITYTQSYQANLKVISTSAEIFDDVLQMF